MTWQRPPHVRQIAQPHEPGATQGRHRVRLVYLQQALHEGDDPGVGASSCGAGILPAFSCGAGILPAFSHGAGVPPASASGIRIPPAHPSGNRWRLQLSQMMASVPDERLLLKDVRRNIRMRVRTSLSPPGYPGPGTRIHVQSKESGIHERVCAGSVVVSDRVGWRVRVGIGEKEHRRTTGPDDRETDVMEVPTGWINRAPHERDVDVERRRGLQKPPCRRRL